MRIAIITLPLNFNYGGLLQAYALQAVLERLGHTVEFLDRPYRPHGISPRRKPIIYTKRFIKKYLGGDRTIRINQEDYFKFTYKKVCRNTDAFIHKYLHRRLINSFAEISPKDYDAIVVGSDQIWRAAYVSNIESAYLDFAIKWDIKRISYAASLGVDFWEYTEEQTGKCKQLIKLFNGVSVREETGVLLIKEKLDFSAIHVLDPTMLLNRQDYERIICDIVKDTDEDYLFSYVLDESEIATKTISDISSKDNLFVLRGNSLIEKIDATVTTEQRIHPHLEKWLRNLVEAKIVITDSFHACIFSLLFHKQFYVIANPNRGNARVESLLKLFNIGNRYIGSYEDSSWIDEINYDDFETKLSQYRITSLEFLNNHLS